MNMKFGNPTCPKCGLTYMLSTGCYCERVAPPSIEDLYEKHVASPPHPSGGAAVTDERLGDDAVTNLIEFHSRKSHPHINTVRALRELQSRRADPVREELGQEESGAILPTASEASMNKEALEAAKRQHVEDGKQLIGERPDLAAAARRALTLLKNIEVDAGEYYRETAWLERALACSSEPSRAGSMANNSSQGIRDAIIEECVKAARDRADYWQAAMLRAKGPLNRETRSCCAFKRDGANDAAHAIRVLKAPTAGALSDSDRTKEESP